MLFRLGKENRMNFYELPFDTKISAMDKQPTLRELTAPNLTQKPLTVKFPELGEGINFELKTGLVHLLPQLHGLSGKDPNKHLSEFHAVCTSMKPRGVTEDQIKLRAFPFPLKDSENDWFYYLDLGSIDTWAKMKEVFLAKYFPATRLNSLKRNISNIGQQANESLYVYHDRFMQLVASCPYHRYSDKDLVFYLYNGLMDEERRILNAPCGGSILNKTPAKAFEMIIELAEESRQFIKRAGSRSVHAVDFSSSLRGEVTELKDIMRQLMLANGPRHVKSCGICSDATHPTGACPTLQEPAAEVNVVGGFGPPGPNYNPYSYTYNVR